MSPADLEFISPQLKLKQQNLNFPFGCTPMLYKLLERRQLELYSDICGITDMQYVL